MLHAIAYGASQDWATVPAGLQEIANVIGTAWIQSRINEKGNKVMRDSEQRDNRSHVAYYYY